MQIDLFSQEAAPVPEVMKREAIISECGKYRYALKRTWDQSKPAVMFIMLNPSTADDKKDDNTVTRCINYAKSWGYGSLFICNVFAYRSTHPNELLKVQDPFGPDVYKYINSLGEIAEKIICAWGNKPIISRYMPYDTVHLRFDNFLDKLYYLAMSKDDVPIHPLYLNSRLTPVKFENEHKNI